MNIGRITSSLVLLALIFALPACGGGSNGNAPLIEIMSPNASATFRSGETFMLSVATNDFQLEAPAGTSPSASPSFRGALSRRGELARDTHGSSPHEHLDTGTMNAHNHGESQSTEHSHEDGHGEATTMDDGHMHSDSEESSNHHSHASTEHGHSHGDSESGSHNHEGDDVNPFARAGHLHLYIDGGDGSDPHITTWSYDTPVTLPENLSPGMHSLRIQARDSSHTKVGDNHDQFLMFEVVE